MAAAFQPETLFIINTNAYYERRKARQLFICQICIIILGVRGTNERQTSCQERIKRRVRCHMVEPKIEKIREAAEEEEAEKCSSVAPFTLRPIITSSRIITGVVLFHSTATLFNDASETF